MKAKELIKKIQLLTEDLSAEEDIEITVYDDAVMESLEIVDAIRYKHEIGRFTGIDNLREQPKPAESKPVGWFRLNGVEFHPVDGTAEERERAVAFLVDALGVELQPKPAGDA